jgi:hypothetical protein
MYVYPQQFSSIPVRAIKYISPGNAGGLIMGLEIFHTLLDLLCGEVNCIKVYWYGYKAKTF